jgi:hypothetical protein
MIKNSLFIVFLSFTVLVACSKPFADCITERNQEVIIRWGEIENESGMHNGFMINSKGELFLILREGIRGEFETKKLKNTKSEDYCPILNQTQQLFIQNQVLNHSGGETSNFIELVNRNNNVFSRGIWNPDIETDGNKQFRNMYQQLMNIVDLK